MDHFGVHKVNAGLKDPSGQPVSNVQQSNGQPFQRSDGGTALIWVADFLATYTHVAALLTRLHWQPVPHGEGFLCCNIGTS